MSTPYQLVVVSPFGDYQRGDVITDQEIVASILDVKNEMHSYEPNIRRANKFSEVIE